jgi:hypothetical protein
MKGSPLFDREYQDASEIVLIISYDHFIAQLPCFQEGCRLAFWHVIVNNSFLQRRQPKIQLIKRVLLHVPKSLIGLES